MALWLGAALAGLAGLGLAYLALAIVCVLRIGPRSRPAPALASSVTILKPLHGAEPGLLDNLETFCRQDYGGAVRMVCGVQAPDDPAIPIVRVLQARHPERAIDLVIDPTLHGTNRKVSNLINMAAGTLGDLVVLADSDMRVGPDYLARLADALAAPGVGAVTCLYHGVPAAGLWSRLSALAIDTHFLPSVAVGIGLGLAKPCFGSTIALRRETLASLGGFRAIADDLADDYALGAAVRRLGLSVAVPPFTIGHVCTERSAADLVRQELRWTRTIRAIDPAGHAGSALSHPFAFACLAAVVLPGIITLSLIVAAWLLRVALTLAVERRFGLRPHAYWLVPARDAMSFGLFVASFFGRGVTWRGHAYGVTSRGALIPKAEP